MAFVVLTAVPALPAAPASNADLRRARARIFLAPRQVPFNLDRSGLPRRFTPRDGRDQPLYPAEPLPAPGVGGGGGGTYITPIPLPGNIIVEVPTYGRGPAPARLDRILHVGPYLTACWRAPASTDHVAGVRQLTLRMGFKRNGALMGPPRMTYSSPPITTRGQPAYVAALKAAFQRCTPLPLTPGFGRAIAGVPFAIRFTDRPG